MNINQKQTVIDSLEAINSTDIEQLLIAAYPSESDFSKINISKYNVAEFLFLFNKMISQLEEELKNGLGFLLPFTENYANDFGAVNLQGDLSNIHSYLNSNQFAAIEPILDRLIHYQIKNGFWNKSEVKSHPVDLEVLKKQKTLIDLNQKALDKNLIAYDELKTSLLTTISDFNVFINQKKQELILIATLLSTANTQLIEINTIVSNATNKDTEIEGLVKNIKDKVITVSESITEYDINFTAIKKDNSALKLELEITIVKALEDFKKSEEGIEFIESNRSEIVRLTGMAADGSLGSKFDQRQVTLAGGLSFWKWGVPAVTILSILWVIIVFACLPAHKDNVWINLLISLLKTSPAFILMGFVFSQYSKERNLQEEYAFKSAVAMTLTAYSGMLEKSDDPTNKTRQEMLLNSIQQVYLQPRIHSEKPDKIYSINGKHLKEAIQTLSEAVKNIKGS